MTEEAKKLLQEKGEFKEFMGPPPVYANRIYVSDNKHELLFEFGYQIPGRNELQVVARAIIHPEFGTKFAEMIINSVKIHNETYNKPVGKPPEGGLLN